ncbi:hypothetical protein [Brevundimonas diminuta]|uniref:hypothetical protein n=1 Tax=Brevundimonas diminuta TaxID=293 RepID=UPI001378377B|nr:hypothetical protein [Brevundimonas diminuta]
MLLAMTENIKEQMVRRWREMAERDRETLAIWRQHDFRTGEDGRDTTDEDRQRFEESILRLEDMIARVEASS